MSAYEPVLLRRLGKKSASRLPVTAPMEVIKPSSVCCVK